MAIKKLSTPQRSEPPASPVVNAVDDEALREEVALIVAATGRPLVEETVPGKVGGQVGAAAGAGLAAGAEIASATWRRAPAVFIDATAASRLSSRPHCEGAIFLVRSDLEEENAKAARLLAPVYSASLPADNVDICELLGRGEPGVKLEKAERLDSGAQPEPGPTSAATPAVPIQPSQPSQPAQCVESRADAFYGNAGQYPGHFADEHYGQARENSATCTLLVPAVGGAGASVAAAAFSLVLSREQPVCLVDADELGGGLDLVLGMEDVPGLRWQDFSASDGRLDGTALYEALPASPASPVLKVLTWARVRNAGAPEIAGAPGAPGAPDSAEPAAHKHLRTDPGHIANAVGCLIRDGITVVVDCPRQPGFLTVLGALADDTVIVTPAAVRAIAAAGRLAEICAHAGLSTAVAVRHQQHREVSVDDVEYALDLPIVGEIEYCKKVARELDVGGLAASVGKLVRGLAPLFARAAGGFDG